MVRGGVVARQSLGGLTDWPTHQRPGLVVGLECHQLVVAHQGGDLPRVVGLQLTQGLDDAEALGAPVDVITSTDDADALAETARIARAEDAIASIEPVQ
jgi:hypothetical protein